MSAARYRVATPTAFMRGRPDRSAEALTELLYGEPVAVGFSRVDWAEVESLVDGYRGFLEAGALIEGGPEPTHRIGALKTIVYPEPNMKVPATGMLSFRALVRPVSERNGFVELDTGGWIYAGHLAEPDAVEPDFVQTALRFLEVPYLWGGRSALGIDCSGLVQLSLAAAGIIAPRDSGPQRTALGQRVLGDAPPRSADLCFWPGHVGIMVDSEMLIHANAHHMAVAVEPLASAVARIGARPEIRRL